MCSGECGSRRCVSVNEPVLSAVSQCDCGLCVGEALDAVTRLARHQR